MRIDRERLTGLRQAAGISKRALAKASGQSLSTAIHLEDNGDASHLPCVTIERIATALGVPPTSLFESSSQRTTDALAVDSEVGTALAAAGDEGISVDAMSALVGRTGDDVLSAIERLAAALGPFGMGVTRTAGRVQLVAVGHTRVGKDAVRAADRRSRAREHVDAHSVRVLHAVLRGVPLEEAVPDAHHRRLVAGSLRNAGLITGDDTEAVLGTDVRYSLMLD